MKSHLWQAKLADGQEPLWSQAMGAARFPHLRPMNVCPACVHAQAVVQTVTTGSPRVLDPSAAAWYDELMGVTSTVRYVNNMDIVPSFPLGQSLLCGPCNVPVKCSPIQSVDMLCLSRTKL